MRLPEVVALALVVAVTASIPASQALAAPDCPKLVELADWGENSTGDISVAHPIADMVQGVLLNGDSMDGALSGAVTAIDAIMKA